MHNGKTGLRRKKIFAKLMRQSAICAFVFGFGIFGFLLFAGDAVAAGSGTYVSPVKDYGANVNFGDIVWNTTVPANTEIGFYARVCADATCSTDPAWGLVATSTTSGYATTTLSVADNNRYFQYRTILSTSDDNAAPIVNEVSVRTASASASGTLTSSAYDSSDASNIIGNISWTATGTTTNETVKFQIRTATTSADLSWHQWCGPSTTCDGTSYFLYTDSGVALSGSHPAKTGGDDKFVQYKVTLGSEGINTPTLTGVTVQYVVNAPPTFNPDYPSAGAGGVTASQTTASSTVTVSYSVKDTDATSGTITPNVIAPSFEYSLNNGASWTAISSGLWTGSTSTKSVLEGSYTTHYATWTASVIGEVATTTTKIRVTTNDGEPANATAQASSTAFILDTKKPVNGSVAFDAGVAGETGSGRVTIAASDDSALQYFISDDSATHASPTNTGWVSFSGASTTVPWTFDSDIERKSIKFQLRDAYYNTTATTTVTNAAEPLSSTAFLVQDVSKASQNDWRLYIAWQTSTSSNFASYKLEYATSTDNTTFSSYADVTTITNIATNYYVHTGLNNTWYYRYRVGVKDTNSNTTVRSNSYINARPDGVQNLGEGGGGTSPSAAQVTNVVPSQGATGNVTVTYTLTDTSLSSKTTPTYEAYVAYDLGVTLTSSSTNYIELSDTTKLPASGFIQINQEVIGYSTNTTSTNRLTGITRGTWPTTGTSRATRQNTNMLSQTQAWIIATSTQTAVCSSNCSSTTIPTGQANSITWTTSNDTNLANQYLTNVGVRVLVHDNQAASSAPLSSQSDSSVDSTLAVFDKKAPTLTATSLLINGSSSNIEVSGSIAPLTLTGVSGDTASETIYIQFATSTPAVYRGANSDGTLNMTENSWGTATTTASLLGSWSWPLSGRSETVRVRIKDAYGNISSTDTNDITKNAMPEFNGTQTNADASSYESISNDKIVIRQCNIYDTDPLCTSGRVKVKFQVRDPDAGESQLANAGSVTMSFGVSTNGVFATSTAPLNLAVFASDGSLNTTTATSSVSLVGATSSNAGGVSESVNYDPAFTTVTAYYTPSTSATIRVQVSVTDGESGSTPVYALSNQISYDKSAPTTGVITFDGGIAGTAGSGTITVPVPADATTTQYMFTATSTSGTLTWGWTTYSAASTTTWGFDSAVGVKSVDFRYRDTYGNTTATATATSLVPPAGSSITLEDISTSTSARLFLSWPKNTDNDFANYRIEYATSSTAIDSGYSAYAELALITNKDTNYFIHTGLNSSWWYRYRLSTKNTPAGNYSVKSLKGSNAYVVGKPDQTLTGDEAYASDTNAPSITSASAGTPQVTSVTITIQDFKDAESLNLSAAVYYAPTDAYDSNAVGRAKYAYKFGSSDYATQTALNTATTTTVTLAGLTKAKLHYFAVEVCDVTGNCTLKEDASYTFTTSDGPAIVIAPSATKTYNSATITWKTDKASDSIVYYSTNSGLTNAVTAGSNTQSTADALPPNYHTHTVGLSGLSRLTTYYYKVRSTDTNNIYSESNILNFVTDDQPTPQITTAPSCNTTASTAIVSWATNQNTTTEVSILPAGITNSALHFDPTAGAQLDQYPGGPTTQVTTTRATADYVANHSHTFISLTESTTYYVKVQSVNANGGQISGTLTCITPAKDVVTIGRPSTPTDTSPPLIGGITIKDLKSTSATITWTTDEPADSLVQYGTTLNYGSLNGNVDLLAEHTVVLSGLKPETAYNFKVTSADRNGNRAYAGDQSFTMLSEKEEALLVKEDLESLRKELEEFRKQAKNPASLQEATLKLKAILRSVSTDIALGDLEELASDISDTITDITQEIVPPTIIGGVPQVEIESTKAMVKWKTNKPSGSMIALVPQGEYDAKAKDPYTLQVGQPQEEVTEHTVVIPNLNPSTVYHFQIRSQAKVGPEGKSRDFVFETKAELPLILEYSFRRITENSITVAWKTNTLSTSLVRYTPFDGTTLLDRESNTQGKPEFIKDHEVTVANLKSNTNFLVEISSADVTGATASKVIGTVRTTLDAKGPVITKVRSESTIFPGKAEKTQTIIYWETDEPATSQLFWKEGVAKGDLLEMSRFDQEYTTSHVVVITSFKPGAVYRFQVESVDPSNNKVRSTDYTILTPKKGETVIDLIITNFQDIFGFLKKI